MSESKKSDPHAWDFMPITYSPEDLDYKKFQSSTLESFAGSFAIPSSAYGKSPVSAVNSLVMLAEEYQTRLLTAYRPEPRWSCGLPGCRHRTREGAAFHVFVMVAGMPEIVTSPTC